MESFWGKVFDSALAQGDYLIDCPTAVFDEQAYNPSDEINYAPIDLRNLIIVTQSCDLEQGKVQIAATCPIYSLDEYEEVNPVLAKKGRWEEVRKGRVEGLHLLSSPISPENNRACLVVDFREIYSLPVDFLTTHAALMTERWRLKSPYLEHFSQAFARFFMRVGLPSSIPPFK
jgi:hypothetical protein